MIENRLHRRAGLFGPVAVVAVVAVAAWFVISNILSASEENRSARSAAALRSELTNIAVLHEDASPGGAVGQPTLIAAQQRLDALLEDGLAGLSAEDEQELRWEIASFAFDPPTTAEEIRAEHRVLDGELARHFAAASGRAESASQGLLRATVVTAVLAFVALLPTVLVQGWARSRVADARVRDELEHRHRALVEHSPILTYVVADDGTVDFASPSATSTLGHRAQTVDELLDQLAPEYNRTFGAALRAGTLDFTVPHIVRAGADNAWYEVTLADHRDDDAIRGVVITAQDVTARVELEQLLRRQAGSDKLTGLANRRSFDEALAKACAVVSRSEHSVGVLLIDLDGFKEVNDTLGHQVGDEVLVTVADRLAQRTRANEHLARLGGDEFVLIVEHVTDCSQLERAASRLVDAVRVPIDVGDELVGIDASVGIALAAGHVSPDELVRHADLALYDAKRRGRGRWSVYDDGPHQNVPDR